MRKGSSALQMPQRLSRARPSLRPLVHCLTNAATAAFVTDAVAAVGGRAIMAEDPEESAALAATADGLLINLGQVTKPKQRAMLASLRARKDRPWVLDPVGVGVFPDRLAFARTVLGFQPSIIRGNASEIWALATGQPSGSGTESTWSAAAEVDWPTLTQNLGASEVCITQAHLDPDTRDLVIKAPQVYQSPGGRPIMGQLAGFGCALSAVAATLGSARPALELFSKAGQEVQALGLGAFRPAFLSALARLGRAHRARAMMPLYFVAGPQDTPDLPQVLDAALAGGISCFQYRPKLGDEASVLRLGKTLRAQCRAAGVPFIANDSPTLALALDADGVHLGQEDGDLQAARLTLGPDKIIGLSISTAAHWQAYAPEVVDYVGLGPFADTQTKPDTRTPLGAAGITALRQGQTTLPSVAIGGVSLANAADALSSGVSGLAVVTAITQATDPAAASRNLTALVQAHLSAT